jgi:hypothetical protein
MNKPSILAFVVAVAAGCTVNTRNNNGSKDMAGFNPNADLTQVQHCLNPGPDGCPIEDCSEQAKLVYVVDQNNQLSSFKPDTLAFTDIGLMKCPAETLSTPFSMAVDREAVAWVLYSSGEVFKVDTTNAKCTATGFVPGQQGFQVFGMGFSTTNINSPEEKLFIAGGMDVSLTTSLLGTLDTKTLKVTKIGNVAGSPELTGTSDATLWGFFPDTVSPRVAGIDKQTGALSHNFPLPSLVGQPAAWAFAYWGGDFWIFLQRDTDDSTIVWHLKTSSGLATKAIPDTGRVIVGAGVSTCAPTTIM